MELAMWIGAASLALAAIGWGIRRSAGRERGAMREMLLHTGGRALPSERELERIEILRGAVRLLLRREPLEQEGWTEAPRDAWVITARWVVAPGPPLSILPRAALQAGASRASGRADEVVIGESVGVEDELRARWAVLGDAALARAIVGPGLRAYLDRIDDGFELRADLDGVRVGIVASNDARDRPRVDLLIGLAIRVASHGLDRVRAVATALGATLELGTSDGPPALRVASSAGAITVAPRPRRAATGFRWEAALATQRALPAFACAVGIDGRIAPDPPRGLLGARATAALARTGRVSLRGDAQGRLTLGWDGDPDPAQLRAGVELLDAIATEHGGGGAFR